MQTLTLDFETHFDPPHYSLTTMTTIEYILDKRWEVLGLGAKLDDEFVTYLEHPDEITDYLNAIYWEETILIGHNLIFDGGILAYRYNIHPKKYIDTASMSRVALNFLKSHSLGSVAKYLGVGEKKPQALYNVAGKYLADLTAQECAELCKYCISDVENSYAIYKTLDPYISETEYELIDITTRMFTVPKLKLDPHALKQLIKDLEADRQQLVADSGVDISTLRSTAKLSEVFTRLGARVPTKESPRKKGEIIDTYSKDTPGVQELKRHQDPAVRNLIQARLNVMSSTTLNRAKRFLDVYNVTHGDFPVPLMHAAAHTGRWAGSDKLNVQNLTKGPLRECIIAPEHHVICVVDLGQIEARITAWLAEHIKLLAQFADPDIDPYCEFAGTLFSVDPKSIDKKTEQGYMQRFVGKTCILGLGFGMGHAKLLREMTEKNPELGWTKEDAVHAVGVYRTVNYPIAMLWKQFDSMIVKMSCAPEGTEYGYKCLQYGRNYIRLPSGRCLTYPGLHARAERDEDGNVVINQFTGDPREEWVFDHKGVWTKLYGGHLTENVAQALARDIIGGHMIEVNKIQPIATCTHDEILTVPHIAYAEKTLNRMLEIMTVPPSWAPDLPLAAEGAYNERYTK